MSPSPAHFDADAERKRVDPKLPGPTFTLCGQEFSCLPALPGATSQRMVMAIRVGDRGRQVLDAPNLIGFIEESLIARRWVPWEFEGDPEESLNDEQRQSIIDEQGYWEPADDRTRFIAITEGTEDVVDIEDLGKVFSFLSEWYGERPTRRSKR